MKAHLPREACHGSQAKRHIVSEERRVTDKEEKADNGQGRELSYVNRFDSAKLPPLPVDFIATEGPGWLSTLPDKCPSPPKRQYVIIQYSSGVANPPQAALVKQGGTRTIASFVGTGQQRVPFTSSDADSEDQRDVAFEFYHLNAGGWYPLRMEGRWDQKPNGGIEASVGPKGYDTKLVFLWGPQIVDPRTEEGIAKEGWRWFVLPAAC